jgi:hypothetical protein
MNAKKYREEAIKDMVRDIKSLEKDGLDGDDLWEAIDLRQYSYYATEEDKAKAFRKAGYSVELG